MKDEDVGVLAHEAAIDHLGLGECIRLEVDEPEKVQDVGVVGPQPLGLLQLPPRLRVPPLLERLTPSVVMKEEDALVERRGNGGTILGHAAGIVDVFGCQREPR